MKKAVKATTVLSGKATQQVIEAVINHTIKVKGVGQKVRGQLSILPMLMSPHANTIIETNKHTQSQIKVEIQRTNINDDNVTPYGATYIDRVPETQGERNTSLPEIHELIDNSFESDPRGFILNVIKRSRRNEELTPVALENINHCISVILNTTDQRGA